jgi:hypothetical protein
MGYETKDIADITEPKTVVSLSALPYFIEFANKTPNAKVYQYLTVQLNTYATDPMYSFSLRITDNKGSVHDYKPTDKPDEVGAYSWGRVFYISPGGIAETAENLRQALLSEAWFTDYYDVVIPFDRKPNTSEIQNGITLHITSKGTGTDYNVIKDVAAHYPEKNGYIISWIYRNSLNNDSISGEASTVEIAVDVYADAPYPLGKGGAPIDKDRLGNYLTTLRKTYAGSPVWFDLNAVFSRYNGFTVPPTVAGWFNTGTARSYRAVAAVNGINSFPFYTTDMLYVLNGYSRLSESPDMNDYIGSYASVKMLTNKPRTKYMRGQREYLNFLFKAPSGTGVVYTYGIAYQVHTQSDEYLGTVYAHQITSESLDTVNTCVLDIDTVLNQYPAAGIIRVALAYYRLGVPEIASNNIEYTVLPDCLHSLRQFTFLNQIGGWDNVNFDASLKSEIKPVNETYIKTITPDHTKSDGIERLYVTSLSETLTVEGAPVSDEVAEWLKELAASRVVIDEWGNYVIIEDFTLVVTDATKNMQKPTIKYRLSETYTNE